MRSPCECKITAAFLEDTSASSAFGSFTHLRTVLRDKRVSLAISCNHFLSRKYSRLILSKISMVITFLLLPKI